MKYKSVHMPEELIKIIDVMDTFTTNIQTNYFDSDHFIAQGNHFDDKQDDSQAQCDDADNSNHESYNELNISQ